MNIIKEEHMWFLINFTFAYYGVKRQLPEKKQYEGGIKGMKELMGWEKEETKSKIAAILWNGMGMKKAMEYDLEGAIECFEEALKKQPESLMSLINLSKAYEEDGDFSKAEKTRNIGLNLLRKLEKEQIMIIEENPEEEFRNLTKQFYEKREVMQIFTVSREIYKSVLGVNEGLLSIINILLNDIRNFVRGKDHKIPENQIADILEDVIQDVLEWLSILSGLVYYNIRDELGDKKLINDLLDALLRVLGEEEHHDLNVNEKRIDPLMINMLRQEIDEHPTNEIKSKEVPQNLSIKYPEEIKPTGDNLVYSYRVVQGLGHSSVVDAIALSKDEKYLASASWDNTVRIWDTKTVEVVKILRGHSEWATTVAISPDGKYVVSGGMDKIIIIWDFVTGKKLHVLKEHKGSVWSVAISPDSKFFVSSSEDNNIFKWDLPTGKLLQSYVFWQDGHNGDIETVKLSSEGTFITSASIDKTIKVWDLAEMEADFGSRPVTFKIPDGPTSMDVSSDDLLIISTSWDNTIRIRDSIIGKEKRLIKTKEPQRSIVFSPDINYFASSTHDEERSDFSLWDFNTGEIVKIFDGHEGMIRDLLFSSDGTQIYSASEDNTIKVWDISTSKCLKTFQKVDNKLSAMMVHPEGKHLLTSSDSRFHSINIWMFPSGKVVRQLKGHNAQVKTIEVSKDGIYVVSAAINGIIKIWRLSSRIWEDTNILSASTINASRTINSGFNKLACMSLSDDWQYIVGGSVDGIIKVWDFDNGKEKAKFTLHKGDRYDFFRSISSVDISKDNKYIAAGSQNGKAYLWELKSKKLLRETIPLNSGIRITAVKFTPYGKYIAISSLAPIVYMWNLKTGEYYKSFAGGHEKYITTLAFSHNGKYLVSGSEDNRVMIHNLDGAESYGPFQLSSRVIYANLIPHSDFLLAGDSNGELYVWNFKKNKLSSDIRLIFLENFEVGFVAGRIGEVTEHEAIESYHDGKIDAYYNVNKEILEEGYLDRQLMPNTEIFMLNRADLYPENRALLVYVFNIKGIAIRDIAEAFQNYLPKYGDHRYYEGMHYIGDYRNIPVYKLYLGS